MPYTNEEIRRELKRAEALHERMLKLARGRALELIDNGRTKLHVENELGVSHGMIYRWLNARKLEK